MATTDPNSISTTDMTNNVTTRTISSADNETTHHPEWQSPFWSTWYGYYKFVPDLKAIIDAKANWIMGKGYTATDEVKNVLTKINGNGKDTFNSVMENMIKAYTIGGDSFAEIIKDTKGNLINLKPINPSSLKIKGNSRGQIARYEHWVNGEISTKFRPEQIFHLSWGRMIDEIHGISTIETVEKTVLSFNEAYEDMRIVFHRYVKPIILSVVDTDDVNEISSYKAKIDKAVEYGENMVVPKGTLDHMERMSIPQYSTLDPIPWIHQLQRRFIIANGVPEIILGHGSDTTEASSKILYLAFQQMIEGGQRFIEEQVKAQLDLEINLEFPASLEPAMQKDVSKERNMNNMQMKHDAKK